MIEALTHVGRVIIGLGLIILAMFLTPFLLFPALGWKIYVSITNENRNVGEILTGTAQFFIAIATSIDKFGNSAYGGFFNAILLKNKIYKFGNTHETISEVLGWGFYFGDLSKTGLWLYKLLNKIDDNHCEKARLYGLDISRKKLALINEL